MRKYYDEENEDFEESEFDYNDSYSAYDNPYYNDELDMDQQSQDFWDSL